jgi:hypothetical protein
MCAVQCNNGTWGVSLSIAGFVVSPELAEGRVARAASACYAQTCLRCCRPQSLTHTNCKLVSPSLGGNTRVRAARRADHLRRSPLSRKHARKPQPARAEHTFYSATPTAARHAMATCSRPPLRGGRRRGQPAIGHATGCRHTTPNDVVRRPLPQPFCER